MKAGKPQKKSESPTNLTCTRSVGIPGMEFKGFFRDEVELHSERHLWVFSWSGGAQIYMLKQVAQNPATNPAFHLNTSN